MTSLSRRGFLGHSAAYMAAAGLLPRWANAAAAPKPNIVLIVMDDGGYGDIGSYGGPDIRTPNIDSLARDGARLTDFYANGPSCSPTRAGLISGRYQQRFAIEAPFQNPSTSEEVGLPVTGRALPQLLKNTGYATALIGKWHLGYKPEFSPNRHGFDYFYGFKAGYIDYYQHTNGDGRPDFFENDKPVAHDGYMTDLITDRSIRFINDSGTKPFFLEISYNAPHWPYQVPDMPSTAVDHARHLQPNDSPGPTRAEYVAMFERADRGVGQILAALAQRGLADNTIVIYTHDNGGEWLSRNAPLFNRKQTVWEGGIRVPLLVRWPGKVQAGIVSGQVGITMDLSASLLAAAGATVPPGPAFEGIDLLSILAGRSGGRERTLFWRITGPINQKAVRSGDWKLVVDGASSLLFNVRSDVGERNDLTSQRQDIVRQLRPLLDAWEADVDAEAKANGTVEFNRRRPAPAAQPAPARPG
jgi:arylsulfatase A-like enzyme